MAKEVKGEKKEITTNMKETPQRSNLMLYMSAPNSTFIWQLAKTKSKVGEGFKRKPSMLINSYFFCFFKYGN